MKTWYDEPEEDLPPSKSELKRQMLELQKLGEKIVKLSNGQLATVPLEGLLQEAILTARRITSHEGLRRQLQYIGKLLRDTDTSTIEAALLDLETGRVAAAQKFKALEARRDKLIEEGPNAIEEIMAQHPQANRQQLRQLVMQAAKERKANKTPSAAKKLFQLLKELENR